MGWDVVSVEWDGWVSPEGKMVSIMRLFEMVDGGCFYCVFLSIAGTGEW